MTRGVAKFLEQLIVTCVIPIVRRDIGVNRILAPSLFDVPGQVTVTELVAVSNVEQDLPDFNDHDMPRGSKEQTKDNHNTVFQNIKKYDEWLDRTVTELLTVSNTEENLLDFTTITTRPRVSRRNPKRSISLMELCFSRTSSVRMSTPPMPTSAATCLRRITWPLSVAGTIKAAMTTLLDKCCWK